MHLRPLGHLSVPCFAPATGRESRRRTGAGRGADPFSTVHGWARKGGLTSRRHPCRLRGGELSEWPKEPDSKSGVPVRVPWVRIPRSPPARWRAAVLQFIFSTVPRDEGPGGIRGRRGGGGARAGGRRLQRERHVGRRRGLRAVRPAG